MNTYKNPKQKSIFVPSLLGGLLLGLLSTIPIINIFNLFCCFWVLLGGFVAVLLYKKDGGRINAGKGSLLGFIAGLWGSLVVIIFQSIMFLSKKDVIIANWLEAMEQMNMEMPPELMSLMSNMDEVSIGLMFISAFGTLIVYSIFATLGGLIGAAILKPKTQYQGNYISSTPPEYDGYQQESISNELIVEESSDEQDQESNGEDSESDEKK